MLVHVRRSPGEDQHDFATFWVTVLGIVIVVLLAFIL